MSSDQRLHRSHVRILDTYCSTYRSFALHGSTSFKADRSIVPDLLHDLSVLTVHVVGWEPYSLHDLYYTFPEFDLPYKADPAQQHLTTRWGTTAAVLIQVVIYRSLYSYTVIYLSTCGILVRTREWHMHAASTIGGQVAHYKYYGGPH